MKYKEVIVIDDHDIVRKGICEIVNNHFKCNITEASDGEKAIELVEKNKYNLMLLDISMPKIDGLKVLEKLREKNTDLDIIMVSSFDNPKYIEKCIELNCNAFLLKNNVYHELPLAFESLANGDQYFSDGIKDIVLNLFMSKAKSKKNQPKPLTNREKEVLSLVIKGNTSVHISDKLFISIKTVEAHRTNILKKMDVKSTPQLITKVFNEEGNFGINIE